MPINIPSNYSGLDSPCSRRIIGDETIKPHSRKYNVKKIENANVSHNNQSNKLYEDRHNSYHRSRPLTTYDHNDIGSKYRFKSYDYLPMKYQSDQFSSSRYANRDIRNDLSDSVDNYEDYGRDRTRFTRPYGQRHYSSNEEVDNSRINDYSSDNSRRYPYTTSNQNYGDYVRDINRKSHNDYKYSCGTRDYEDLDRSTKYDRSYNPGSCYNSTPQRSKRAAFSTNFANYANNNKSDASNIYKTRLHSDETKHSRHFDGNNNDNYSRHSGDVLKSTHRIHEDVPHSGTRLEKCYNGHRKSSTVNHRYNESKDTDQADHFDSRMTHKCYKMNKCTLPPSSKHSCSRKVCSSGQKWIDNHKSKFSTPQRTHYNSYHGGFSANENGCLENCRNSNNDCFSIPQTVVRSNYRDCRGSMSDTEISSTTPITNEKATYTIPQKPIPYTVSTSNSNYSPPKDPMKESSIVHRRSSGTSRHRSNHKRD